VITFEDILLENMDLISNFFRTNANNKVQFLVIRDFQLFGSNIKNPFFNNVKRKYEKSRGQIQIFQEKVFE